MLFLSLFTGLQAKSSLSCL